MPCCIIAASLDKKVRELYAAVCRLEEEKYDWEARLGRQTEEVSTLSSEAIFTCAVLRHAGALSTVVNARTDT